MNVILAMALTLMLAITTGLPGKRYYGGNVVIDKVLINNFVMLSLARLWWMILLWCYMSLCQLRHWFFVRSRVCAKSEPWKPMAWTRKWENRNQLLSLDNSPSPHGTTPRAFSPSNSQLTHAFVFSRSLSLSLSPSQEWGVNVQPYSGSPVRSLATCPALKNVYV